MSSRNSVHNVSDEDDPIAKEAFKFFCRHLVAITGTAVRVDQKGNAIGKTKGFAYSGFIVSVRGTWLIATAGHVLQGFEKELGSIRLGPCHIVDTFGPGKISKHPIPFDLADAPKFYVHEDEDDSVLRIDSEPVGLDFGIIALSSNNIQLLRANNIVPVSDENMRTAGNIALKSHLMIGFPDALQDLRVLDGGRVALDLAPVMAGVTELDPPPPDLPKTKYPRFVGQLLDTVSISIKGMSGGPIIGFAADQRKYWVAAIQSTWFPKTKITFGCPTPLFLELVEQAFDDYESEQQH
jgi:hypothetical protein